MPAYATVRHVNGTTALTGLDLKVRRVQARVKQIDLASEIGCTGGRVSQIEREQFPSSQWVTRYLEALDRCRNVPHNERSAA